MSVDNHQMNGLDSKLRKVLVNLFDRWLPSAVMNLTNKTISSCTINNAITGNLTGEVSIIGSVETAEHGAGVIGTGVAPKTYRYNLPNGDICTEIQVDLQGLTSKNTANDVIGLAAGGVAKLGQYVVATWGVVYRIEMFCLETPAGGDDDVNVVMNATGTLEYDGAGGTSYGVDGGNAAKGKLVVNNAPSLTTTHYVYLTAGTGDTAAAYTAGQFVIRFIGKAALA